MEFETENIEFKSTFTERIYKEVIAFANTNGGVLYIGIDNEGNAIGLTNVDEEYTRITNGIRDSISPDVTMCIKYTIQDNKVVMVTVSEGTNKPYYLKAKGLKPSGVYVRQGASSVQATLEQIRRMIKESDGDTFESIRSLEQSLTFESAEKIFKQSNIEFSKEKYRALGITNRDDNIYTNLALIMSDQSPYSIKIAVFSDDECTIFRDSREFKGSIFTQFENAVDYLALCNKTNSSINGMIRIEKKDYPEEAIREALLNALVHRDYSFSGSIIINITDKKMEFISLGGLVSGLSKDDIRNGISEQRNRNLCEVFYRLRLIESYGTGIRRIYKLYEENEAQPQIEVTENSFKIILPNMNENSLEKKEYKGSMQMKKVVEFIKNNKEATDEDIKALLDLKSTRVYNLLREMKELNIISIEGRGKNKKYILK